MTSFAELLDIPANSISPEEKTAQLLPELRALQAHHVSRCPAYRQILEAAWPAYADARTLTDIPYIPVGLFKRLELSSTDRASGALLSSGTTGQQPSRIVIDAETADRQSQALVATFRPVLGEQRLPLLLVDSRGVLANPSMLTARGAGVLGMMKLGARATFALDSDLNTLTDAIAQFAERYRDGFVIFGFTFLIWTRLYEAFADGALDLSSATLIHSGGWKMLEARKVSNETLRAGLARRFGLTRIVNFYGFVEQIGSMFLEVLPGLLRPPVFTDVIIRDPITLSPVTDGKIGLIQTLSVLPRSYPGHSVLTEDLGVIEIHPDPETAIPQRFLRVLGRLPRTELRGCSDVIASAA